MVPQNLPLLSLNDELAIIHAIRVICELKTTGALIFRNKKDFAQAFEPTNHQIIIQSYPHQTLFRKDLARLSDPSGRRYFEIEDVIGPVRIFRKKSGKLAWKPVTKNPIYVTADEEKLVIDIPITTLSVIECMRETDISSVFRQSVIVAKSRGWRVPMVFLSVGKETSNCHCDHSGEGIAAWAADYFDNHVVFLRQIPTRDGLEIYPNTSVKIAGTLWKELQLPGY